MWGPQHSAVKYLQALTIAGVTSAEGGTGSRETTYVILGGLETRESSNESGRSSRIYVRAWRLESHQTSPDGVRESTYVYTRHPGIPRDQNWEKADVKWQPCSAAKANGTRPVNLVMTVHETFPEEWHPILSCWIQNPRLVLNNPTCQTMLSSYPHSSTTNVWKPSVMWPWPLLITNLVRVLIVIEHL